MKKECLELIYKLKPGQDKDGVLEISLGKTKDTVTFGLSICIKTNPRAPLITCIDDQLLTIFSRFVNKNVTIYNELLDNPPFPAWKDGLNELWN